MRNQSKIDHIQKFARIYVHEKHQQNINTLCATVKKNHLRAADDPATFIACLQKTKLLRNINYTIFWDDDNDKTSNEELGKYANNKDDFVNSKTIASPLHHDHANQQDLRPEESRKSELNRNDNNELSPSFHNAPNDNEDYKNDEDNVMEHILHSLPSRVNSLDP